MAQEEAFRLAFIAIFAPMFSITGYFRRKARRSGEIIPRAREGKFSMLLRSLFAAPIYLSFLAYMIHPEWMRWSSISLPIWLRWLAIAVGLGMLPVLYRVVSTLSNNISETVFTKKDHKLVTLGPYRRVRHPLYSVATIIFVSLGTVAANWFIIVMAILIIIVIALIVVPEEEAHLIGKFGPEYREYMKRTGMLAPPVNLIGKISPHN
jgi:protein-S-isoprenylcysteine O-methyltransferase Ste14